MSKRFINQINKKDDGFEYVPCDTWEHHRMVEYRYVVASCITQKILSTDDE